MSWTDERIAQLKKLWEKGLTASQIAEALGNGLSRNAVIGKAHRLGLKSRPSPVKSAESAAEAPAEKAVKPAEAEAQAPVAAAPAEKPAAKPRAAKPAAPVREKAAPAPAQATEAAPAPAPAAAPAAEDAAAFEPAVVLPRPAPVAKTVATRSGKDGKTTLLDLTDRICKWPFNHPDEADFHFCGQPVNPGFPYCTEHCAVAYQAQLPRRDRPRPLPFPGMRTR